MQIIHNAEQGEFGYFEDEVKMGKLRYRYIKDDVIDVFSTKVDEAFQGKGIAGQLYLAVIEFAKENQFKIKPSCSYIDVKMQRSHPDLIA
nr:GNAT family N-acetyltransferase [uncultured Haemophilus sp.]